MVLPITAMMSLSLAIVKTQDLAKPVVITTDRLHTTKPRFVQLKYYYLIMLLALKVFAKSIIYPLFIYTSYRQRFQNPDIIKVILWRN
jgi:hypothetical protein